MIIDELLSEGSLTPEILSVRSGVSENVIKGIISRKIPLEDCSAATIAKLAQALKVSEEFLKEAELFRNYREQSFEYGLPGYLQHDLDAYKDGVRNHSTLLDCLWCELYSSINIAEIDDGVITHEHADYLRNKFLFGESDD